MDSQQLEGLSAASLQYLARGLCERAGEGVEERRRSQTQLSNWPPWTTVLIPPGVGALLTLPCNAPLLTSWQVHFSRIWGDDLHTMPEVKGKNLLALCSQPRAQVQVQGPYVKPAVEAAECQQRGWQWLGTPLLGPRPAVIAVDLYKTEWSEGEVQ